MKKIRIIDFNPETLYKTVRTFIFNFDFNNHCWKVDGTINYGNLREYSGSRYITESPEDFIQRFLENVEPSKGYYRTIKSMA